MNQSHFHSTVQGFITIFLTCLMMNPSLALADEDCAVGMRTNITMQQWTGMKWTFQCHQSKRYGFISPGVIPRAVKIAVNQGRGLEEIEIANPNVNLNELLKNPLRDKTILRRLKEKNISATAKIEGITGIRIAQGVVVKDPDQSSLENLCARGKVGRKACQVKGVPRAIWQNAPPVKFENPNETETEWLNNGSPLWAPTKPTIPTNTLRGRS